MGRMNGFPSNLHPATKLVCALAVSAATPLLGVRGLLLMPGVLIFASLLGDVGLAGYRRALRSIIFLLMMAGAVGLFAEGLSYEGLLNALVYFLRFFLLFLPFWMLMETTDTGELRDALMGLNLPHWLVVSIFLLLKNVQEGSRVLREVKTSQISRGASLDRGNFVTRLWNSRTLVVPLFVWGLVRSQRLSIALQSRGFSLDTRPTQISKMKLGRNDILVIILMLLLLVMAVNLG
ncbi:energy-coupling factor transporter transmembrane protein EcfT [Thermococcus sp. Bubb.Bath]|uniref:energy-coupling factor transporter transmembrane component T family protein n=1 Tax=Thermococcus sp. Bubb.Bath TaxID=1638242 RepID=UPI001438F26C|nr:energy-coupling factor transporter transmembrane component T [Thermococcus sp. Bubb.Bath]NJF24920.1 hypothetical protein [Thermococcus sp. Bubb.Bath]